MVRVFMLMRSSVRMFVCSSVHTRRLLASKPPVASQPNEGGIAHSVSAVSRPVGRAGATPVAQPRFLSLLLPGRGR
jgi:hypothetical protein